MVIIITMATTIVGPRNAKMPCAEENTFNRGPLCEDSIDMCCKEETEEFFYRRARGAVFETDA